MTAQTNALKSIASASEVDWEKVYAEQLPRVYNFFRYHFGNAPQAEDLTALTFEKAWRGRKSYRHDLAAFSTWLFTIARHVAVDYARRRRDETSLEAVRQQPASESPEELVEKQSEAERLAVLLIHLSTRERELVAYKYGAGLTNREIAQLTGLSESNVGTILYRVVQNLRAEWEEK